jgi:hypothetical protein
MNRHLLALAVTAAALLAPPAWAKLPPPSDEAKAKAAEAAAKTAHNGKIEAFQLCKARDRAAAHYFKTAAAGKKDAKAGATTPPCADPGPFNPAATSAPAPAPAAKKS